MTPPTWSQVPARAAGLRATKAAKRPPRATDQTIKHVRAFAFRSDRLDNPRPPEVESAERIRRTTTGGHVARAIRGLFINRLPRDYLSRYAPVLTRKNYAGIWRKRFYHFANIEMRKSRGKSAEKCKKSRMDEGSVHACVAPTAGSDHFLLHDLLHAHRDLLCLVVLGRHPVAARVAHDRIGRNHRAAGGTRDLRFAFRLGGLLRGRLILETVAARVAHDRIGRNHRAAGGTRDLRFAPGSGLSLDRGLRDRLRHLRDRDRHLRDRLR